MATNNADWFQPDLPPRYRHRQLQGKRPWMGLHMERPPYTTVEYLLAMDQKLDTIPADKIELHLDEEVVDITSLYEGGALVDLSKESAPDEIESGDMQLRFANTNDLFTELDSADSELYNRDYHNKMVRFYSGFQLPDGSKEYALQATMDLVKLEFISDDSSVILSLQDRGRRLLDLTVNRKPDTIIPTAGASNVGNGLVSDIAIKPFSTVAENWTLTCTLAGGAGVATFSVVGSVSGNVGTATDGTTFSTGNKVKLLISAGSTAWAVGDAFTFSTPKMMEFNSINPIKIIWSILTGYNWDTEIAESWQSRSAEFSPIKSGGNPDIDFAAFSVAAAQASFNLKGYVEWDTQLTEVLQDIALHFLGAIFINEAGQISIEWFEPSFGADNIRTFADSKKIFSFRYSRDVALVINRVRVSYQKLDSWDWDLDQFTYNGVYVSEDEDSIERFGLIGKNFTSRWFSSGAAHVAYFAEKVVDRFSSPPWVAEIETGSDALLSRLGDRIRLTDTKSALNEQLAELIGIQKDFTERPRKFRISAIFEENIDWGFLGSTESEGDSISAQPNDYVNTTTEQKRFAYASTDGTSEAVTYPESGAYGADALPENSTPAWTKANSGTGTTSIVDQALQMVLTAGTERWRLDSFGSWPSATYATGWQVGIAMSSSILVASGSGISVYPEFWFAPQSEEQMIIKLYSNGISFFSGGTTTLIPCDPSGWHVYKFVGAVVAGANVVRVYMDEVLLATITITKVDSYAAFMFFGFVQSFGQPTVTYKAARWWVDAGPAYRVGLVDYRMF